MTVLVRLTDEAERDVQDAATWYEKHRPGLGHEFLYELLAAKERIASHPAGFQLVYGQVRRAFMRRFPFAIMYLSLGSDVWVVAVMHCRRDPQRWRSR